MNSVTIIVPDPDSLLTTYGAGALISVERASAQAGTYAVVQSIPLVAATTSYAVAAAYVVYGDWYRTRYTAADGDPASAYSSAWQATGDSGIVGLAATKIRLAIATTDTTDDALLQVFIGAVTTTIQRITGRQFVGDTADTVYYFDGREAQRGGMVLPIGVGIQSVTKLELAGYTGDSYAEVAAADYFLDPPRPKSGWPYESIEFSDLPSSASTYTHIYPGKRTVKLTGRLGWAGAPDDVANIAYNTILRLYRGKQSGEGEIVGSTPLGHAVVLRRISPEERKLLDDVYAVEEYG